MDLRHRLILTLGGVLLAWLAVACALVLVSLREDVADEMAASTQLARLLLSAAQEGPQALKGVNAGLRHLNVEPDHSDMKQPLQNGSTGLVNAMAAWLQRSGAAPPETLRFEVGGEKFIIRADPRSEIAEIMHDTSRQLLALAAFGVVALLSVWLAVGRALSPVRELERRLDAVGRGCFKRPSGRFALPEFARISRAIDQLSANLAAAQARECDLTRRLISVQEEERCEIARELHDELGQSLVAIAVSASYVERNADRVPPAMLIESAADIRRETHRVQGHVRELLARLKPHGLEQMGVLAAVREHVQGWAARASGITTVIDLPDALPRLPAPAALALYRTVQEALTNVLKHSRATRVRIALEVDRHRLVMCVTDNGVGTAVALVQRPGCGIRGMRERAAMVGGRLRIEDAAAAGVMLAWELPLQRPNREDDA